MPARRSPSAVALIAEALRQKRRKLMSALYLLDTPHSLEDRVFHALQRQPHLHRRPIRYELIDQDVVLMGCVQTYYQKQMAQESLRPVTGIRRIINELEVVNALR